MENPIPGKHQYGNSKPHHEVTPTLAPGGIALGKPGLQGRWQLLSSPAGHETTLVH
jgi:hypothetical protein